MGNIILGLAIIAFGSILGGYFIYKGRTELTSDGAQKIIQEIKTDFVNENVEKISNDINWYSSDVQGRTPTQIYHLTKTAKNLSSKPSRIKQMIKILSEMDETQFRLLIKVWSDNVFNSTQDPIVEVRKNKDLTNIKQQLVEANSEELFLKFSNLIPARIVNFGYPDYLASLSKLDSSEVSKFIKPNLTRYITNKSSEYIIDEILSINKVNKAERLIETIEKNSDLNEIIPADYKSFDYEILKLLTDSKYDFNGSNSAIGVAGLSHIINYNSLTSFINYLETNEYLKE